MIQQDRLNTFNINSTYYYQSNIKVKFTLCHVYYTINRSQCQDTLLSDFRYIASITSSENRIHYHGVCSNTLLFNKTVKTNDISSIIKTHLHSPKKANRAFISGSNKNKHPGVKEKYSISGTFYPIKSYQVRHKIYT